MRSAVWIALQFIAFQLYSQNVNSSYEFTVNWSEQVSGVNSKLNCISAGQYNDVNTAFICGGGGVVLRTTNAGINWINISGIGLPSDIDLVSVSNVSTNILITGGNTNEGAAVYRTTNGGVSWYRVFTQQSGETKIVRVIDPLYCMFIGNPVGGRWSIWRSTDLGEHWDSSGTFLPQSGGETGYPNSFSIQPSSGKMWFGTNNYMIYQSSNSGITWTGQNIPEQNVISISSFPELICGGTNMYSSTNHGSIWHLENIPGSGNINGILNTGLVIGINQDNLSSCPIFFIRSSDKIYYSDKGGGQDWEIKYTSAEGIYEHINGNGRNVWAIRNNGGITYGRLDMITSVPPNNYPYSFELRQNYPNPFNPKTTIPIVLHKLVGVTLNIYSSTGKRITTFEGPRVFVAYDNDMNYVHTIQYEWDGTDYPSGVYFYEVIADDYQETRKMMLVK